MNITNPLYPRSSKLGVLRMTARSGGGNLIVSTSALYRAVGAAKYAKYLPMMEHAFKSGPTPDSCERFLRQCWRERKAG